MSRVSPEELERRSKLIRDAMEARSPAWSVTELAAALGAHWSGVSRIVSGHASGSSSMVAALARVLSIDLNLLLVGDVPARGTIAPADTEAAPLDQDEIPTLIDPPTLPGAA